MGVPLIYKKNSYIFTATIAAKAARVKTPNIFPITIILSFNVISNPVFPLKSVLQSLHLHSCNRTEPTGPPDHEFPILFEFELPQLGQGCLVVFFAAIALLNVTVI